MKGKAIVKGIGAKTGHEGGANDRRWYAGPAGDGAGGKWATSAVGSRMIKKRVAGGGILLGRISDASGYLR